MSKPNKLINNDRVILGIDPGTRVMGYGVLHVIKNKPQMLAMGVYRLDPKEDHYMRLRKIYDFVIQLVEQYLPDELAIEAPFYDKNVQSMLKLGRAQGVAMAAVLSHNIPITEYAPLKIKMALTGNGSAAKEQVAYMVHNYLKITDEQKIKELDATDGMAAALCHYLQTSRMGRVGASTTKNWKDYIQANPQKVKK